MKRIVVRIHHSTYPPFKLHIRPNTRVFDVVAYLNLTEDDVLVPLSDQSKTFTTEEDLYAVIETDQKLIAKPNRAMTLFTSLGPSADCRGLTQVPTYQGRIGHARGAAFSVSQRGFSLG